MTASLSGADVEYRPRRRDRRESFGELLASLTRALDSRGDLALMRGAFEESLRRLIPVHSVQLRESTSELGTRGLQVVGRYRAGLLLRGFKQLADVGTLQLPANRGQH